MLMDWNKLTLAKNNLTQLYIQMDLNWKNVNVHDWISFCKCSFEFKISHSHGLEQIGV